MDSTHILNRVRDIIVEIKTDVSPISPEAIEMRTNLTKDLGLNSIDFVRMIVGIEDAFCIIAQDSDLLTSSLETVGDVVAIIQDRSKNTEALSQKWLGGT